MAWPPGPLSLGFEALGGALKRIYRRQRAEGRPSGKEEANGACSAGDLACELSGISPRVRVHSGGDKKVKSLCRAPERLGPFV